MRVLLKNAAYAGKRLFPRGVHDDWPDDIPVPKSAEVEEAKIVEEAVPEPEPEPDTLSELQKKGSPKK